MYCRIPSAHAANGTTNANSMYSVYSTILRTGGENTRGGTTVAATRPSAAMPSAAPAANSVAEMSFAADCRPYCAAAPISAATAMATRMMACRRSRKALARKMRMAATAPSTTSCAHSRSPWGVTATHDAGTARAATPSSTPVSTVLDLRAAAATWAPESVTSDGGPSSTGEIVSSGWPAARAKMSRPVIEPNVCRGTFAIRSEIVGAAETATRTATNTATAIRGPGTSQYIRTRATTAAPKPAVMIAAAAVQ